jgi:ParB family chromosome partitioning protein
MNKRLGRGLDALIPSMEGEEVVEIHLSKLRANPYQPRKVFPQEQIEELAQSIKQHGVIQPIVVRSTLKDYEIVAGERRWRAAKEAGLSTIPAVVKPFTDEQVMEIALIENLQREDLNPLEIAVAYQKHNNHFSLTQEELAVKVGKSRPHIANFLRLLQLPDQIQQFVSRGTLSMGHARALLSIKNSAEQLKVADEVIKHEWSVRDLENYIQQRQQNVSRETKKQIKKVKNQNIKHIEESLTDFFGTNVRIKEGKTKSRLEIDFFSYDDLNRICALLKQ